MESEFELQRLASFDGHVTLAVYNNETGRRVEVCSHLTEDEAEEEEMRLRQDYDCGD